MRRMIGWLLCRLLLCRLLLRRRLDCAAAGRRRFSGRADRWLGRAGRSGGRGRRGCGGRRRRRSRAGAFAPADQLAEPVDDQRDQDQNKQEPGDEQRGTAVPRGRLESLVVRFGGFGFIGRSFGWCIRRRPVYAEGGLRGLLVVEVIRRAVTCHGNDGTDTTCRCCSQRVDLLGADEPIWAFGAPSCLGSATNPQLASGAWDLALAERLSPRTCGLCDPAHWARRLGTSINML